MVGGMFEVVFVVEVGIVEVVFVSFLFFVNFYHLKNI